MERNRTVLVDMDGVMADFDSAALINVPTDKIVEKSEFYVAKDYPAELRQTIEATYNSIGFLENIPPMPGLFEAWQTMIDNGFEPRVASAPLSSNPSAIEGKIKWLDQHMVPEFGPGVVEDAIIDKNKWKYDGLALIDDRQDVERGPNGETQATWQHILFGWEHRATVPLAATAFRLLRWNDTKHLLQMLDQIKQSN